jgi:hypothetical protein
MARVEPQENWTLQQKVQHLAKLKNNKPMNNHKAVQLQLQDLNFAKLNQTRTRTMERSSEHASTTEAVVSTIKKRETKLYCNTSVQ